MIFRKLYIIYSFGNYFRMSCHIYNRIGPVFWRT